MVFFTGDKNAYRIGPSPLPGGKPSITVYPMPPGPYSLVVEVEEGKEQTVKVQVRPGETTQVTAGPK
jgi:hypothetical protein